MCRVKWEVRLLLVVLASPLVDSYGFVITSELSCRKNEEVRLCKERKVPELRCPDVNARGCQDRESVCSCADEKHRNTKDECVAASKCGKSRKQLNQEALQRQRYEKNYEMFRKALQVLSRVSTLDLQAISAAARRELRCVCMKITKDNSGDNNATRRVNCYTKVSLKKGADAMIKPYQKILLFILWTNNTIWFELEPASGGVLSFSLKNTYEVLEVAEDCFLLKTGEESDGKPCCMVWGEDSEKRKTRSRCYQNMKQVCAAKYVEIQDYREPCEMHDKLRAIALGNSSQHRV